jgi:carbon monoxide dehydrogenase subunit G
VKLEGTHPIHAPRDAVWSALLDPEVLAKALPGSQELEKVAENEYKAAMRIRVGPVQGLFSGSVKLSDLEPPTSYRLLVDGRGAPGFVKGEGDMRLEDQGATTVLHYQGDVQVGGRLASVGQRLMESSALAMIRQSLEALDAQIAARLAGPAGEPAPAVTPPSELRFAAGVAGKMLEDLLPPERRQQAGRLAAAALGALLVARALFNWWSDRLAERTARRVVDLLAERE